MTCTSEQVYLHDCRKKKLLHLCKTNVVHKLNSIDCDKAEVCDLVPSGMYAGEFCPTCVLFSKEASFISVDVHTFK